MVASKTNPEISGVGSIAKLVATPPVFVIVTGVIARPLPTVCGATEVVRIGAVVGAVGAVVPAEIVSVAVLVPAVFVAVIVNTVAANAAAGVPEITPVTGSITSAFGKAGAME